MKKLILITILFLSLSNYLFAQFWGQSGTYIYNTNNGNVGIGTSNPSTTLGVNGTFGVVSGSNSFLYNGTDLLLKVPTRGTGGRVIVADVNNSLYINYNGDFTGGTRIGSKTYFAETSDGASYINTGGLGIGTTALNGYKLAVNGSIHTKSLQIDLNGWLDYVLKPTYNLRPLTEVKTYIDQHQHLPEIPSEQEMIKDGLNVSEMNKLLMKKVEELTLYAIENERKDKEREAAKDNALLSLQKQIDALKHQVKHLQTKTR